MGDAQTMRAVSALIALVVVLALPALAGDRNVPHEHQGKLKPYPRPPMPLALTAAEQTVVLSGTSMMRQFQGEGGGRGLAVFLVRAPPDTTWSVIQDFKSYPKWISAVKQCDIYSKAGGKIDVSFQASSYAVSLEYFIHHDFDIEHRWGTWTLDYQKKSDLDDSVGFWRVNEVPGQPEQSIVEYSVDIAVQSWVPNFVRSMLVDTGMQEATTWVRVQSEKQFQNRPKPVPASAP